jgi:cobalt-zinc-cadmium efflux system outer membrane protein
VVLLRNSHGEILTVSRLWLGLGFLGAGCAGVERSAGYAEVAQAVEARTGHKTQWDNGTPDDAAVRSRVAALVSKELTLDGAVEVTLLNNPALQAHYEQLGVAQADLVQAGLLRNPSFDLSAGFPLSAGAVLDGGLSLVQDFLSLFLLPMRRSVAEAQLQQAQLSLAHDAFATALAVREAYYRVQAAQQEVDLQRLVLEAYSAAAELAARQRQAGNVSELDASARRAAYEEAQLALARDELELSGRREALTRLLGLEGPPVSWRISAGLPDLPSTEVSLERLGEIALAQRLDLAAARKEVEVLERALDLARTSRWVGTVDVGVSAARDAEGLGVLGPSLRLELPVFDQRQALIAGLEARQRAAERRREGLSIDARSEVRAARAALQTRRQLVERYRTVLLLREQRVALSQRQYDGMLLGVYQLLAAKESQVDGYRDYIAAVRDYWVARVELERALGGPSGGGQS